jgi:glycosyltransferase involved in cell wall biosynthesis
MSISTCTVSVVIPAFNASSTIDETLRSVRSQSHGQLEIIVVDDGSTDDTVAVAQRHAAQDSRIIIISQCNAGVAAARNAGWQAARADFIAFIDADDLWAICKIERQLRAMIDGGERTGLVYSWHACIDANSLVSFISDPPFYAGEVLDYLFEGNFVGNGSSALVRREALVAANGFEGRLRASGAQGCEDLLFYCRVAEGYQFAVVPEYQIGYRVLPNNMSSDMPRMFRSWMLVADEMAARHPDRTARLDRGLTNYGRWLLRSAAFGGQLWYLASIVVLLCRRNPLLALKVFALYVPLDTVRASWRKLRKLRYEGFRRPALSFPIGDPDQSR